ncbi:unnamed protein product [Schistosoma intercalatum]|nr:unnamed protein product [Schistosoma intercalatum]
MFMYKIFFSTAVVCALGIFGFIFLSMNIEGYPFLISISFKKLNSSSTTSGLQILRILVARVIIKFLFRLIGTQLWKFDSWPFKGDRAAHILKRRISDSLKRTFFAATLRILFSSRSLFANNLKDKLSHLTNSMCIYQFTCSCGARYIGRSMRTLSKRIQEHCPAWLRRGGSGSIRSSIIEHLVNTGHSIKTDSAFKVIYKVSRNLPKTIRLHLLCIAEAIAIHFEKPELCVQKRLVQPLLLPWS